MKDTVTPAPLSGAATGQPVSPGTPAGRAVPLAERLAALAAFLEEHKAEDVVSLELAGENAFAEAMLVATAGSMRQAQALADGVAELSRERGFECLRIEGYAAAQWILVDCNDIIIHILLAPARELYRLEDLWGRAVQGRAAHSAASPREDRP
ncbi:MAG: ribosome silencing factor [Desulfovibrio sp.]|nr:ribosome silencing factor [Desulfovibrio sp.]